MYGVPTLISLMVSVDVKHHTYLCMVTHFYELYCSSTLMQSCGHLQWKDLVQTETMGPIYKSVKQKTKSDS